MLTTQARKREHLIGQVQTLCKEHLQKHLITYTETIRIMETLKLVFYILGSAAFLGLIIFFIALLFNKDNGIDLEQSQINYLSREVERLDKKISKEDETKGKKYPDDFIDFAKKMSFKLSDLKPTEKDVALAVQKQQFDTKEKMYVEKIRQLEKEVLYQKGRVDYSENRLYKEINKESEKQFKVVMTVTKEDDNILDAVDNVLAEANKQDVNINTNRGSK